MDLRVGAALDANVAVEVQSQPPRVQSTRLEEQGKRDPEELPGGAIRQHRPAAAVEGEHRHLDLVHHAPQERARFQRPHALGVQGIREVVDLEEQLAQGIASPGAAPADGEILLAERREQVRRGLQRAQDALAESQRREEPDQDRDGAHGPADLAVVDVEVEEQHAGKHRRRARSKREQKDVLIVRQPLLPPDHEAFKPWCCRRR